MRAERNPGQRKRNGEGKKEKKKEKRKEKRRGGGKGCKEVVEHVLGTSVFELMLSGEG